MGQEFSGNCDVASRHPLLHNGATNATRSRRSDSEEAPPCRARGPGSCLARSLATANFYEKALFVKVDVATALWWKHLLFWCEPHFPDQ